MVELFQRDIKSTNRQSSKGNQLKWENSGTWYKADYTGYEGLADYYFRKTIQSVVWRKPEQ